MEVTATTDSPPFKSLHVRYREEYRSLLLTIYIYLKLIFIMEKSSVFNLDVCYK